MEEKAIRIKNILNSSILKDYLVAPVPELVPSSPVKSGTGSDKQHKAFNRSDFFRRLESYSPITWFAKPQPLSPPFCARYGWVNIDVDMLKCVTCNVLLCGSLPKEGKGETYQEAIRRLQERLTAAHKSSCPWSLCPSPESFMNDSMDSRSEAIVGFRKRLQALSTQRQLLPATVVVDSDPAVNQQITDAVTSAIRTPLSATSCEQGESPASAPGDATPAAAIVLALTGWCTSSTARPGDSASPPLLCCELCRRKVGLWSHQPGDRDVASPNSHRHMTAVAAHDCATGRDGQAAAGLVDVDSGRDGCRADAAAALAETESGTPRTKRGRDGDGETDAADRRRDSTATVRRSDLEEQLGNDVACCAAKRRRAETEADTEANAVDVAAGTFCSNRGQLQSSSSWMFNALEEHRPWCPWLTPLSQNAQPQWKLLFDHLSSHAAAHSPAGPTRVPSVDNVYNVRRLMNACTSPSAAAAAAAAADPAAASTVAHPCRDSSNV